MKKSFLPKSNREFKFKYTPRFASKEVVLFSNPSFIGRRFAEGYFKKKNQSKIKNNSVLDKIDLSEFRNHQKKKWSNSGKNFRTTILYAAILLIFLYTILQFLSNIT